MTAPARLGWVRRNAGTLVISLGVLLALATAALLVGDPVRDGYLDPDGAGPYGARAVARVLEEQGVDVEVVRSADDLEAAAPGRGTTVVVTGPEQLGASTADRLLRGTAGARLVVVQPTAQVLDLLGVDATPVGLEPPDLAAGCDLPLVSDLIVEVDLAEGYDGTAGGCFGEPPALVTTDGLTLLGLGDALSNRQVLRADDAALALRLLGQDDRLVWYVPTYDDLAGADGVSLGSLLPSWLRPALLLGGMVVVSVVVWRARRLGPLATEPLPVVVRAVETTRSRGRMYRRAGDRGHAARALREAALRGCADHLGLGRSAEVASVVAAVAARTGRSISDLARLLDPDSPAPTSDRDLVALADDLTELDREVRTP